MKQEVFIARHAQEWATLERWLDRYEGSRRSSKSRLSPSEDGPTELEFPARYRRLCQQLAIASGRGYSPLVVNRLQALMERGHGVMYRPPAPRWRTVADYVLAGFPRLVRANARCMLLAALLLYVPMLSMIGAMQVYPELAHAFFSPAEQAQFEEMYDPTAAHVGRDREASGDMEMFGLYIWNNVSIGFRTFASGLVFGIGAIVVLVMNGVSIGAVAGHLQAIGYGAPFWKFVVGHSAFELTAVVICGGAGLRLGLALIAPGRQTRGRALVEAGVVGAQLAMGGFAMLVCAAFIEAFWSSNGALPAVVKYSVGAVLWSIVLFWLWRGGRGVVDAH
ncbi:MAG TPA: stage II sporulation protein M [Arenimonas sp.]|uniref:stage II sporulation protein M n=1 Tax=Arenimonas sp. TaxID=1872635 RepID=UPI002C4EA0AE|nr:stage II sporulation protein M [Arenimonas sp.]HMB56286.1 stage II sporulation protein M [Arenimonas sp.]